MNARFLASPARCAANHRTSVRRARKRVVRAALCTAAVMSWAAACTGADRIPADRAGPLAELPTPADGRGAVLVVHERDCDTNLGLFDVFEQPSVAGRISLVGAVLLDDAPPEVLQRALKAYDVPAPVLAVTPQTREALRTLVHDRGMSVVVFDSTGRPAGVVGPPQTLRDQTELPRRLAALAADTTAR